MDVWVFDRGCWVRESWEFVIEEGRTKEGSGGYALARWCWWASVKVGYFSSLMNLRSRFSSQ